MSKNEKKLKASLRPFKVQAKRSDTQQKLNYQLYAFLLITYEAVATFKIAFVKKRSQISSIMKRSPFQGLLRLIGRVTSQSSGFPGRNASGEGDQ